MRATGSGLGQVTYILPEDFCGCLQSFYAKQARIPLFLDVFSGLNIVLSLYSNLNNYNG